MAWAEYRRRGPQAGRGGASESEAKYHTLFKAMDQGYGEVEIVRDADGRAIDHRYIELNPAYERLVGVPAAQARGRLASEVIPGMEHWWHETFDGIARGGEPERLELAVSSLDRWFSVFAYPQGGDHLILLYEDISERKRAEAALRESEERQAFLLKLSDALRPLSEPEEIASAATRLIAQTLGASRAYYVEWPQGMDYGEIQARLCRARHRKPGGPLSDRGVPLGVRQGLRRRDLGRGGQCLCGYQ